MDTKQFLQKKKPENLSGGMLCHKLTIYKQFSMYQFIKHIVN